MVRLQVVWRVTAAAVAVFIAAHGHAEDIDIFNPNPNFVGTKPNVLFVIDNGASWESNLGDGSKKTQAVHDALYRVIRTENITSAARVGLMPFVHANNPRGGHVFFAVQDLSDTQVKALTCRLYSTQPNEQGYCPKVLGKESLEKTNNTPYALTFNEAYRYFRGQTPRSGLGDGVYDKTKNPGGYDPAALKDGKYLSPSQANSCSNNIIIVIGTGDPDSGENNSAESILAGYGGKLNGDPIALDPDSYQSSWGDEFARFLSRADVDPVMDGNQSIMTYVIDVFDPNSNQANTKSYKSARAYYKSMARQGGGAYFAASNAEDVVAAIEDIINQAQAVNTVFASVSLPISVNVQGTNHNQVFIGMFRPDAKKRPRWYGNLKRFQYKFDPVTKIPYLADQYGNAAYNASSGFLRETASSFWTTSSGAYWAFDPAYQNKPSDNPDGDIVEKGATAQRLRERGEARSLYTCAGGCGSRGSALEVFGSTNAAVVSAFASLSADKGGAILSWATGKDTEDENGNLNYSEARPSIHGDVLHSRPAAVNYFRTGETDEGKDVVVYYGSNDGMFRAVDGQTGKELWAFVPEEQFPGLKRLYDNTVIGDTYGSRPYFADGNVSVLSQDVNNDGRLKATDGDKVWVFISMRRGGRYIYALDVSDPSSPKFMWKLSNATSGFGELGLTWSAPMPANIRALGNTVPVLIFGAGYDAAAEDYAFDADLAVTRPARSQARGVYMVKAETGEKYWHAASSAASGWPHSTTASGLDFSVPTDIAAVNYSLDLNNYAERLYFGDTGGNLWRANIADVDPHNWTVHKLASLGGDCSATSSADCRKFLYPPSIVRMSDGALALLIGSGDREHPFEETVQNRFYMVKDYGGSSSALEDGDLLDVTDMEKKVTEAITNGWYFDLREGEKVAGPALTQQGVTYFTTNERATYSATSCASNLGIAREYFVNFADGTVVSTLMDTRDKQAPGGGFLPPPVRITISDPDGDGVWTGIGGLDPKDVGVGQPGNRQKTYWSKGID